MVTRITGLASGMDIDDIVSKLMQTERAPLDKLKQKKQTLEWQRDSYREVNTKIKELQDYMSKNTLTYPSTYQSKTVTSSNESVLTATGSASAPNSSSTVEVASLATSATYKANNYTGYTQGDYNLAFNVVAPGETTAKTVNISVTSADTIDNVISKLNSSDLGVSAFKDKIWNGTEYVETIAFSSKATGAGGSIQAADSSTADFMSGQLGFSLDADNKITAYKEGTNAKVTINGFEMEKLSNNFTVNGVTYSIKNTTAATGPVTTSVSTDVDGIYNQIKEFVDKYNELVDSLNEKLQEEKYRDYTPLTSEQKEAMSDKEVELWEEKAKSGLLRNDSSISTGTNQMRTDFYSKVNADGKSYQLTEFGITTSGAYQMRGHLEINEDKLKAKIQEDPQSVAALFTSGTNSSAYSDKGIMKRIGDTLKSTVKSIEAKAGNSTMGTNDYSIGKNLNTISTDITKMQDRLTTIENRYYTKFSAMDSAIQKMNEQASYLSQLLAQ
ncbi:MULTISPECIES: flagellar hook-associated protein 2 [Bacillus]|uniref:flagellar hook-associated protein 2 n=1 Tax=Bacillus TaxID=1386 RepID=UPI000BA83B42|nr:MULTISPECIES: flagellar hook-associated protein 2 [Bacillus]POO82575.1 flagellar filament capping protein FliD [Bacillus sp. MBGLi97]AUZ40634.1 flagellar filament capping protein FliD [Bacillus sp. MBGLi79]MCM2581082.1 flagellar hook-associated protein 2 [Bacillus stercoris]MDZ5671324.1 flagellar hook-associated protein 2 [Bacillus stercoris]PAO68950.1 flagellar filament capping protein FliD [Bacillus sp. X2(2017)]